MKDMQLLGALLPLHAKSKYTKNVIKVQKFKPKSFNLSAKKLENTSIKNDKPNNFS